MARRIGLLLGVLGLSVACGRPASAPLDADQILQRMSDKLSAATRLDVTARREADAALLQGRDLQAQTTIVVRAVRPQRIAVQLDSGAERRAMYADGKTVTVQDISKNLYSTAEITTTLDDLDDQLQRLYGFTPPMFEFVTNNPHDSINARVSSLKYLGDAKDAAGVQCHKIAAAGEVADAELWVSAADFLPRQLIATFRNEAGHPQIRLYFTSWNLSPSWSDAELAFTPPAGAMKIPMRSIAEMQALMGKMESQKR